jgi:hypothetical protein
MQPDCKTVVILQVFPRGSFVVVPNQRTAYRRPGREAHVSVSFELKFYVIEIRECALQFALPRAHPTKEVGVDRIVSPHS